MKEAEFYIIRLFSYFNVENAIQLSALINATPQTIANWKSRNSVSAVRRKCQELGIEKEIFDVQFEPSMYSINNQKNDFKHSNNAIQSFGSSSINHPNFPKNEDKFKEFDSDIVGLFKSVYKKYEEKNDLKSLFDILSELKWK